MTVNGTSQTQRIDLYQHVDKYLTGNVSVMRRSTVYLRLAEALNGAGYPHMAFEVLSVGLNNDSIAKRVLPYYPTLGDTTFIREFQFPNTRYIPVIADYYGTKGQAPVPNTLGIHSRGSGFTPFNDYYCMPNDTIEPKRVLLSWLGKAHATSTSCAMPCVRPTLARPCRTSSVPVRVRPTAPRHWAS